MTETQFEELLTAINAAKAATSLDLQCVCWGLGLVAGLLAWQILLVAKDHLTFWGRRND